MANPWYKTGTVTVTNNSKSVTGVGTLWVVNGVANGDIFFAPDGKPYEVDAVVNDTQLNLVKVYSGTTASGQGYGLVRFMSQSPISLANVIVDKTVQWENVIDQLSLYISGTATTSSIAPANLCVNYSLGTVKTGIAQADCPVGFTYVASGANLAAGWCLFSDTVGNYRVAKHTQTITSELQQQVTSADADAISAAASAASALSSKNAAATSQTSAASSATSATSSATTATTQANTATTKATEAASSATSATASKNSAAASATNAASSASSASTSATTATTQAGIATTKAAAAAASAASIDPATFNAATATKLQSARNINGVAFDGSVDISIYAPTDPSVYTIGQSGTHGFGVGALQAQDIPTGWQPLYGHDDPASPNYGNYFDPLGSHMVFIPKFWFKWDGNTPLISAEPADGYALHEAFRHAAKGFFRDKCHVGNIGGKALAKIGIAPLSTATANNPVSGLTGAPANTYAGFVTAIKLRGASYHCETVFESNALAVLGLAHSVASQNTAVCAFKDVLPYLPKGNNNNALKDANDASVSYTTAGNGAYPACALTGSGIPFAKTTHNGQACGVADVNGNMWRVNIGLTKANNTNGFFQILKTTVNPNEPLMMRTGGWGMASIKSLIQIRPLVAALVTCVYLALVYRFQRAYQAAAQMFLVMIRCTENGQQICCRLLGGPGATLCMPGFLPFL